MQKDHNYRRGYHDAYYKAIEDIETYGLEETKLHEIRIARWKNTSTQDEIEFPPRLESYHNVNLAEPETHIVGEPHVNN